MVKEKKWTMKATLIATVKKRGFIRITRRFHKDLIVIPFITLSVISVLISGRCYALEKKIPLMDKVIVTASRQEEKIASVPANVTVISEQEIAQSPAETVPELLRYVPGIVVNDITGNGRNITVDLRGFGETAGLNTLLLIDGRRVNQADLSGVDWTLIPKDRIQRIEIIHGGRGSVMYGDNAAGGVINIITKKGDKLLFSGGLVAGSYNSFLPRLAVSGSTDYLSYALSSNFRTSDGYRDNSGTDAKDVGLNLEYFASDNFNVALSTSYHKDNTDMPGALLLKELDDGISRTASTTPDNYSDIEDYYVQIVPKFFFTETSYLKLDVSTRTKKNNAYSSFIGGSFDAETEIDTVAASPQVVINEKISGHNSKLVAGLDYRKSEEDLDNDSIFFGSFSAASYELSKEDVAFYGNAEVSASDKIGLSAGFRHDRAKFESFTAGVSSSVDMDENLYNAGLTYRYSDYGSAYISYAKSFRYPVLDEMFSFFTNSFDDTLVPQTTDDFEVGVRLQLGSEVDLNVNLFRLDTEQEIFLNPSSFTNENLDGKTIRQGVELKISKRFSKALLYGSYTLRDTEIDGGKFDGNEIPNVPRHQFTVGGETKIFGKFMFNMNGSYIGERPFISDFANDVNYQKSYFTLAAKLAYLFEKGTAYITVKNLLDEEYSEYGGLNFLGEPGIQPAPGINFLLGVTFNI